MDDYRYIQTVAAKHDFRARQRHLPISPPRTLRRAGMTLLGSDSHTPTGRPGMLMIGAGGRTSQWLWARPVLHDDAESLQSDAKRQAEALVSAKDVILDVLRIMTVKGESVKSSNMRVTAPHR